jgi:hypothetical protein
MDMTTKEIPVKDFIELHMPKTYTVSYWKPGFPLLKVTKDIVGSTMEGSLQTAKQLHGNASAYSWSIVVKE